MSPFLHLSLSLSLSLFLGYDSGSFSASKASVSSLFFGVSSVVLSFFGAGVEGRGTIYTPYRLIAHHYLLFIFMPTLLFPWIGDVLPPSLSLS